MTTFRYESEMTEVALNLRSTWWRGRTAPCFIGAEIVGPDAIADLVAARFNSDVWRVRHEAAIAPLVDHLGLRAVLATRRHALTTAELADLCHVTPSGMRRGLNVAMDSGALERAGGNYRAHPAWSPLLKRSVAVELKLRNWVRAFEQATAYARWATATWVMLATRPPEAAVCAARENGIGLATLTADGGQRTWNRPRAVTRPHPIESVWVGEQLAEQAAAAGVRPS